MFPTFVYRKPLKIYKMKRHNGSQTQSEPSFNANMLHLFGQNVLSVGFCSGSPAETTWTQLPKLQEVHRLLIILSQHPSIPILILLIRFAMFAYSVLSNWNKEHRMTWQLLVSSFLFRFAKLIFSLFAAPKKSRLSALVSSQLSSMEMYRRFNDIARKMLVFDRFFVFLLVFRGQTNSLMMANR